MCRVNGSRSRLQIGCLIEVLVMLPRVQRTQGKAVTDYADRWEALSIERSEAEGLFPQADLSRLLKVKRLGRQPTASI